MEIAENPAAREAAAGEDEVEQVLQRVREAVASTRQAIEATQELLAAGPAEGGEDAREP